MRLFKREFIPNFERELNDNAMKGTIPSNIAEQDIIQKEQQETTSVSISQILIAIACLVFFPLLYLIGSTIVSFFQHS